MKKILLILFICGSLLISCATVPADSKSKEVRKVKLSLVLSDTGDDVKNVVKKAFSNNFNVDELSAEVDSLLEKYPFNGDLHEIAAMISVLRSQKGKAFYHYATSALDLNYSGRTIALENIDSMRLTYSERKTFIKVLELITSLDKDHKTVALARNILSHYYLNNGEIKKGYFQTESSGYIRDWWITGAFDNDNGKGFYDVYGPENELKEHGRYKGKVVETGWRKIRFEGNKGFLPVDSFVYPSKDALAYFVTNVFSPVDKFVVLNVSTSDALKIWVNGANVFTEENIENFGHDNVKVKIRLLKGNNTILFKTCQKSGGWSLGARISEISGRVASDIIVVKKFPDVRKVSDSQFEVLVPFKEKEPSSSDVRENFHKSMELYFKGYDKYSMNYIRKCFDTVPQNIFVMTAMINALSIAGEEGKYIDLLNSAILHTSSKLAFFMIMRGQFFIKKGQKESAEADYKKALELNPFSIDALKSTASLFQSRRWYEDARRTLEKALLIEPENISVLKQMAGVLSSLNYKDDSEEIYRKILKYVPGDVSVNEQLFRVSSRKEAEKSMFYFLDRIMERSPYYLRTYYNLFEIYRSRKEYENAFNQLRIIRDITPDNPSAYIKSGDLFYEQDRQDEALKEWEKAHELDPRNSYISERVSYMKIEEKDEAEKFVADDEAIMKMIKDSLEFKADDGAETLLVYDHAVCRINSDGSSKWYVTEVSRALNDTGRDTMINAYLPYDGRKRMLKAYSVSSDLVKSEASSVSSYDIRFRQLKKGDFTVIQYIHYKPAPVFLENNFVGQWFVQSPMRHVILSEWVLIYPEKTKLNIDIIGNRVKQKFEKMNDFTVHKFTANNIEPLNYEPNSPPLNNFLETVTVSTSDSWDKYVNWEKALLKDAFVSAKEIKDQALEITKEDKTVMEKVNKIFTFTAQDIRYQQEYESTIAGVRPHTAAQTLERGYGDCKDKAVLFIQLAKELGIKVEYVIIRTRNAGSLQKTIPNQQFNHAIVYIPKQEGIESGFFMDPTVDLLELGSLRQDDQGVTALKLDVDSGRYEFIEIPFQAPEMNFQKHKRSYTLTDDLKLTVTDNITMRGGTSSYFRQTLRTKDIGNKMFQRMANTIFKGGILKKYEHSDIEDISKPFSITYSAEVENLVSESDNKITITMPEQIVNSSIITLEKRKLPLWTGIPSLYEIEVTIDIPDGISVESTPKDISVEGNCFYIKRTSAVNEKGDIVIKSVFNKKCTEIPVEKYGEFRELILEVIKQHNEYVVLIKK